MIQKEGNINNDRVKVDDTKANKDHLDDSDTKEYENLAFDISKEFSNHTLAAFRNVLKKIMKW